MFAFRAGPSYLGAATTPGRIGAIFLMGVPACLLVGAAIVMATRRSTLSISANEIS